MDLAAVTAQFEENFRSRGELGASVSVWHEGTEILSLAAGWRDRQQTHPWTDDTLVLGWAVTKALASACLLHVLAADGIELSTPVAALWPEFAAQGKEAITLAQLLSHQAGLAAMDAPQTSVLDHHAVAAALAAQAPNWPPGTTHGYHPRTYGFLVDELLRRRRPAHTVATYWRETFAEPLGLDFWIGLPDAEADRAATIYASRAGGPALTGDFYEALADEKSLTRRAFTGPAGLHAVAAMNSPEARRVAIPSFSGIGSARALGKFYAMLANGGSLDGRTFFPARALEWMGATQVSGPDVILCLDAAFSAGFMQDPTGADGRKTRTLFGPSTQAFGQPGAGGGHAFADPENRVAFAYLMNQMEIGVLPNAKSLSMVDAVYAALPGQRKESDDQTG